MGYDVHITRKTNWHDEAGPDITLEEWLSYVEIDPDLRLDGYAEAALTNGATLRTEDPSMVVWVGHPKHGNRNGMAWIWLSQGNVDAKNPDEPTLRKMWTIAQALDAKLQGDDEELYDSSGAPIPEDVETISPQPVTKPWWRFW
jgi:hypothetical protein